jgi:hypothetical protein
LGELPIYPILAARYFLLNVTSGTNGCSIHRAFQFSFSAAAGSRKREEKVCFRGHPGPGRGRQPSAFPLVSENWKALAPCMGRWQKAKQCGIMEDVWDIGSHLRLVALMMSLVQERGSKRDV